MNLKQVFSLTLFALFIVLSVGHSFPGFRSALQATRYGPWIGVFGGILMVVISNSATVYQLWTGKASTWNWQSPETGYQGWVLRKTHPLSYWFRLALWLAITIVIDAVLILIVAHRISAN
ncbi:MAG: hypothetical protein ACTHPD_13510 [Rhizomicrobium sp.]